MSKSCGKCKYYNSASSSRFSHGYCNAPTPAWAYKGTATRQVTSNCGVYDFAHECELYTERESK